MPSTDILSTLTNKDKTTVGQEGKRNIQDTTGIAIDQYRSVGQHKIVPVQFSANQQNSSVLAHSEKQDGQTMGTLSNSLAASLEQAVQRALNDYGFQTDRANNDAQQTKAVSLDDRSKTSSKCGAGRQGQRKKGKGHKGNTKYHDQAYREADESSDESSYDEEEGETYGSSSDDITSVQYNSSVEEKIRPVQQHRRLGKAVKLPAFLGKEPWEVWFNRFTDVADRHSWDANQRLDELLPRLQGQAGEFVYGQLSGKTRGNYKTLVNKLKNSFPNVETSKTY